MIRRFGDLEALSRAAADEVVRAAREAQAARGRFTLVLAGGGTPRRLYELLSGERHRREVDWTRVELFFGDERVVPPTHPGSNYRTAAELLVRPLGLCERQVHRIEVEAGAEAAARGYEVEIASAFSAPPGSLPPAFDLVLLGMGPDGHVASLFPRSGALDERTRWVVPTRGPEPFVERVTVSPPVLEAARTVLVLVSGAAKAEALAAALEGPRDPGRLPAQLLAARSRPTVWLVDAPAAARLAGAAAGAVPASRVLAGDVGGTTTRLAVFARSGDRLSAVREGAYPSREHASLEVIVREFLGATPGGLDAACFAIAGPVEGGRAHTTNLPWTVEASALAALVGAPDVTLVNDLVAASYGMLFLDAGAFRILRAADPARRGNVAVIAPGTGLGEALLWFDGARHHPIPSEGGHADFAPRTDEQIELLRFLRGRAGGHVSWERVLSGDGLRAIYEFLRQAGGEREPDWVSERLRQGDPNAVIGELGVSRESALCAKAVDLFCALLGAEAGNLALKLFATGGVVVGGGIAPKLLPALERGGFMAGLVDKGRLSPWMKTLPVRVALDDRAPLVGAAHLLLAGDAGGAR